jgi:hypothetical protein
MALKATRITGPYSPPVYKRMSITTVSAQKTSTRFFLMGQFCACVAVLIRGRDYRGLAEVLQLFCAEIQLFGATVANFLRANSSSFGSVQTS